jgi:hypothetical protein
MFAELVLDLNTPLIEENEISKWNFKSFSSKKVSESYLEKISNIKENDFCYFDTTIKKINNSVISYFNLTSKFKLKTGYKAMW